MPEPSLSIIIPTCGRETLGRTITSIREQLSTYEDEIIVVGDGVQLVARGILSLPDWRFHYFEHGPTNHYGNEQRDFGMDKATGDFLWFVDDDDIIAPGALNTIHTELSLAPSVPHMFSMQIGDTVYTGANGSQGGPMLITPNDKNKLSRWSGNVYCVDQHFCSKINEHYGSFSVHHEIIYIGDKYNRGQP